MLFLLITSVSVLILCLALAFLGRPPCAGAASIAGTGDNLLVDANTGHIGIGTAQPDSAVGWGIGEVGSSDEAFTRAIKGGVGRAEEKPQFCDGEGRRCASTASNDP